MDRGSFWVLSLLALVTVACAGLGEPTFDPIPTPTTPPDLVKYSDELNSFSIEYPPDWQLALSLMNGIEQELKDFIQGELDVSAESIGVIFMAGNTNFDHNTSIVVESLPSNMSVDEYFDASLETGEELLPSLEIHRISKVDVGGTLAILTESTYESSDLNPGFTGLLAQTVLTFVKGKVAWNVTCEYPAKDDYAERCESIVRTVRILG